MRDSRTGQGLKWQALQLDIKVEPEGVISKKVWSAISGSRLSKEKHMDRVYAGKFRDLTLFLDT